jgi:hypothetical protein
MVNGQLAIERRFWWFTQLSPPANQWLAACPSTANQKRKEKKKKKVRVGVVMAVVAQSTPLMMW